MLRYLAPAVYFFLFLFVYLFFFVKNISTELCLENNDLKTLIWWNTISDETYASLYLESIRIRSYSGPHFPHLDWIWRDTPYISVFGPNMQTRIRNIFLLFIYGTHNLSHFSMMLSAYVAHTWDMTQPSEVIRTLQQISNKSLFVKNRRQLVF